MANFKTFLPFNMFDLDLNRIQSGAYDTVLLDDFNTNSNVVSNLEELKTDIAWQSYTDLYIIDWTIGSEFRSSLFVGHQITVNSANIPNGGIITGYTELVLVSGNYVPVYTLTDVTVSTSEIYVASTSVDTSDDYRIFNQFLAGDDLFELGIYDDSVYSLSGNDVLNGNFGNDFLNAGSGNDIIVGGPGNDWIIGGEGSDSLDGGAGQDTAAYAGPRSDYVVFTTSTGKTLVVDSVEDGDGKDNLQNVEYIRFGTETLTLAAALVEPTDADNSAFQAYRFYNAQTGSHFFTTSIAERNSVIEKLDGLSYEGNAFDSNVTEANGTAVFRFLNTTNGVHFYTAAADEAASLRLNAGFRDEGISYYASNDASNGGTALFRFYNTQNNSHFYTVSEAERDIIINTLGHYKYENVAFYVDAA